MARENEVYLTKLAEQAERYDDMVESIKKVCEIDANLSLEERNLLSVGYKNVVAARRASWQIIHASEQKEEENGDTELLSVIKGYRQKIESDQENICNDAIHVLDTYLIPASANPEAVVFYNKMKADYYRYLAEIKVDGERLNVANESLKSYLAAEASATTELPTTHPIRLGLALNFSVFYYEIFQNTEKACKIAKVAFDGAISELDGLSEETYKDSTLIMQLLRDNLTLWSPELPFEGDEIARGM